MKLRNKDDGRVKEFGIDETKVQPYYLRDELGNICWYKTLSEVTKHWEDYEEPDEYWFINPEGEAVSIPAEYDSPEGIKACKQIGNYFETKEEAERAVEKLKAWKRLKDTGCKPIMWRWKQDYPNDACYVEVVLKCQFDSGIHDRELDLLFGGKG